VFDFNETGTAGTGLDGEDLLAWASFTLVDLDNIAPTRTFIVTADAGDTTGPTPSDTSTDDPLEPGGALGNDWVHVHGTITVLNGNFLHLGPKTGADPAGAQEVDQNLGNSDAEFAFFSQDMNDLLKNDPRYDVLKVDLRGARENDGSEQLFIS